MKTPDSAETKRSDNWFGSRRIVRILLLAALLTLGILNFNNVCSFVGVLWRSATPLIVGVAIAYGLDVVIGRLESIYFPQTRKKWLNVSRKPVCTLAALLVIAFLLWLILTTVLPGLVDAFKLLAREVPRYLDSVKTWLLDNTRNFPPVHDSIENFQINWEDVQKNVISYATSGWSGILSSTVTAIGAVTGGLTNFLMSVIFATFLLLGKRQLKSGWDRLTAAALSESKRNVLQHICTVLHKTFSGFIVGQGLDALILGVLTTFFMLLLGMPYAVLVGVISGTTALLPVIGGYIGAAIGTFLVFTVSPAEALGFLIFIIILQTLVGNLIYPRLLGSSVGMPSLWVLSAVVVGGGLAGIGGMLVGVPVVATAYNLLGEWVKHREKEKAGTDAKPERMEPVQKPAARIRSKLKKN